MTYNNQNNYVKYKVAAYIVPLLLTCNVLDAADYSDRHLAAASPAIHDGVGLEQQKSSAAFRGETDFDLDGHEDYADNCRIVANPGQQDTDNDGFGNACDADLDNSGFINFQDLQLMQEAFFATPTSPQWNPHADFNSDNVINFLDLLLMRETFFGAPGPSGMSCAGSAPCPAARVVFEWPMPGNDADDWVIQNYVDLDPGAAILDYTGGNKSYDGHEGIDIDVPTFRSMDNDFPILAVAQGTVLALEDGNFDRNTSCTGDWNFVTIGHPNGWQTIYGHLKMNSVVVSAGQIVQAGDMLGVVGSSGCSTAPHLHLETLDENGSVISPFLEGVWSDPPVYSTPIGFMDATLYNMAINNVDMIKDPAANATIVEPGSTFGMGLSMAGGGPGDVINLKIVDGNANQVYSGNINFNSVNRHSYWIQNYNFSSGASGPHQLEIRLNNILVETYDFAVATILTGFQQVRHGVPAANYQSLFDDLVVNGYRPVWIDGYDVNGATFFNVIFDQSSVATWAASHGQTSSQYQSFFEEQVNAGRRLVHIDSYLQNGQLRHASIFADQPGTSWVAYHDVSVSQNQTLFNDYASQGFRNVVMSSVEVAGVQRYSALYDKEPVGAWVTLVDLSSAQYQTEFGNQVAAGRALAYLNGYTLNGAPVFVAIFNSVVPSSWASQHDLSGSGFQSAFDNWTGNFGLNTRVVTGYERNNVANFGGLWTN